MLSLTLEEIITIAVSTVALLVAVVSAVIVWIKTPRDERTLSTLDQTVSGKIDTFADNAAVMEVFRDIVDGINENHRQTLKDSSELVLRAAQWIPGQTDNALAELYANVASGNDEGSSMEKRLEDKLTEIENRVNRAFPDMPDDGKQANDEPGFLQDYDEHGDDTQPLAE